MNSGWKLKKTFCNPPPKNYANLRVSSQGSSIFSIAVSGSLNRWDRWYIYIYIYNHPVGSIYHLQSLPIGWNSMLQVPIYTSYLSGKPGVSLLHWSTFSRLRQRCQCNHLAWTQQFTWSHQSHLESLGWFLRCEGSPVCGDLINRNTSSPAR